MVCLKDGVLLQLHKEMKTEEKTALHHDPKSVLLQIRSIIPVLEEGDLWPNRGFFLKVSDASHALYVSLSQEHNEMILGNKLQLGQFIHVQKLEKADPVPLLKGLRPIGGRRPCEGAPMDIVSPANLVKFLEESRTVDSVVEKCVILEKRVMDCSDSESFCRRYDGLKQGRRRSLGALEGRLGERTTRKCSSCDDSESDADNVVSLKRSSRRRSWNESEIFDSSVVKREIKLKLKSRSANVSPVRSARYDSYDEHSSKEKTRRRGAGSTKRVIERSCKREVAKPEVDNVQISESLWSLVCDRKGAETRISWNSLSSNLVECGKEVLRQRDIALLAAANALQEACASERLLNSLSTFSQFPTPAGDHDLQPFVDKFLDLQRDLAHTRLIMQSLTTLTPPTSQETESCTTNSIDETLTIARERRKNADAWIKSALTLDLSPCFSPTNPTNKAKVVTDTCNLPLPLVLAFDHEEEQPEWSRGITLRAADELATSLQEEYKKMFLSYVEKYLDEVDRKSSLSEYDGEMAEMMYKVKMVSDCLNLIVKKDGEEGGCEYLEGCEGEAYGRVRNKIYGILLKHVERTAMAFERLNAST